MSDRMTNGPGPWLVSSETEVDLDNNGVTEVQVWEGSEVEVTGKQSALISAGATKLRRSPKGDGNWQVRASFPFDPQGQNRSYVDVMELEVNATMRAFEQSPVFRSYFSDVTIVGSSSKADAACAVVSDCARKFLSGLPKAETGGTNEGKFIYNKTPYNTRELANQAEVDARLGFISGLTASEKYRSQLLFVNAAYRRVTSFIEYNQVFRRRVTAGSPKAVRANMTGAGKIWTTAEVISFEGIPNDGWFSLPPDVQWHKDKPRVLKSYGQKTELSYAYTEIVTATSLLYQAFGDAILIDKPPT